MLDSDNTLPWSTSVSVVSVSLTDQDLRRRLDARPVPEGSKANRLNHERNVK